MKVPKISETQKNNEVTVKFVFPLLNVSKHYLKFLKPSARIRVIVIILTPFELPLLAF